MTTRERIEKAASDAGVELQFFDWYTSPNGWVAWVKGGDIEASRTADGLIEKLRALSKPRKYPRPPFK